MSTDLNRAPAQEQADRPQRHRESYRAISSLAVASLLFGVLSVFAMADWLLGILPLAGIMLGVVALGRIRRYPDTLLGVTAARMGILLSAVFWAFGYGRLVYIHRTQAPPGYEVINYDLLQPDKPGELIPRSAKDLHERKVYIKGYMYPGRQSRRIRQFIMVRDNGVCGFCAPKPKPSELVGVELIHGLETEYTTRPIGVGGELAVAKDPKSGGLLYRIKADFFH